MINVNIDKDAIEAELVRAIVESSIGSAIEASIKKSLTEAVGPYHDRKTVVQRAVDEAVQQKIGFIIQGVLASREDDIKRLVEERLTNEVFCRIVTAGLEGALQKIRER